MYFGDVRGIIPDLYVTQYDSGELAGTSVSVTISNLQGDTDIEYILICRFVDDTTVGNYELTMNDDTNTSYGNQDLSGVNTTAAAIRATSTSALTIGQTDTDKDICFSMTKIYAATGKERLFQTKYAYNIAATTIDGVISRASVWKNSATEITSMNIAPAADAMGAGTRIILMKKT